jgi:hypothetical protein
MHDAESPLISGQEPRLLTLTEWVFFLKKKECDWVASTLQYWIAVLASKWKRNFRMRKLIFNLCYYFQSAYDSKSIMWSFFRGVDVWSPINKVYCTFGNWEKPWQPHWLLNTSFTTAKMASNIASVHGAINYFHVRCVILPFFTESGFLIPWRGFGGLSCHVPF